MTGIRLVHSRDSLDALAPLGAYGIEILHALIWHSEGRGSERTASVSLRVLAEAASTSKDTAQARLDQLERLGFIEHRKGRTAFESKTYKIFLARTGIEVAA